MNLEMVYICFKIRAVGLANMNTKECKVGSHFPYF